MAAPKIIRLSRHLKSDQWQSLLKYVQAGSDPTSDFVQLVHAIYNRRNTLEEDVAEDIHKAHFPSMNRKLFLNLCSRAFQRVERWIAIQQLENENYLSEILLVKYYNRHGLFKLADQVQQRVNKRIDQNIAWDLEKSKAKAEIIHHQYYSDNPIKYREGAKLFQDLMESYVDQFKAQALLYMSELENWGRLQSHDFSPLVKMIEQSVEHMPNTEMTQSLSKLHTLVRKQDAKSFYQLTENLLEGKIDPDSDLHVIYCLYLIQYALKLWQRGELKDVEIIGRLYTYGLESGVLLVDGKIPSKRFNYVCSVLSATHSYEWSDAFIDQWSERVDTSDPSSMKLVAKAQNCIYHNKEELIPEFTRTVRYENPDMQLRTGALNIISLYKTRAQDLILLHNQIRNFKVALRRQKRFLDKAYHTGIINFLKVMDLLIKRDHSEMNIQLDNYPTIQFRMWLQKQVDKK